MLMKGEFESFVMESAHQLFISTESTVRGSGLSLQERLRVDKELTDRDTQMGICH